MSPLATVQQASRARTLPLAVAAIAALISTLAPAPVTAQVGPNEAACRAAISKAGAKYTKTAQKIIVGCHKLRNAGKIPEITDCNDLVVADTKSKLPAATAAMHDGIVLDANCGVSDPQVLAQFGRCPAPAETIDDGGATSGIDDLNELADCLAAHAKVLAETTAEQILGLPDVPLSSDEAKCHSTIAKGYTKLVNTTVKERGKCQAVSDKSGGPYAFSCDSADPKGKILATRNKAADTINAACMPLNPLSRARGARGLPNLDSCAETAPGIIVCALDGAAKQAASGTAAVLFELPGICPGSGSYVVAPVATGTEVDTGFTGFVHDMDPILGYRAARFTIVCDVDCKNCVSVAVDPDPNSCRCIGDASLVCSVNAECAGAGGVCQCQYGPPTPYNAAGAPACVTMPLSGSLSGSLDPATGAVALTVPARVKIFSGIAQTQPCPLCMGGSCSGGARNGLACTVDASDATFGDVSYDCPPSLGSNISGAGLDTIVNYTTGSVSLPFGTPCDPPLTSYACACAVCTGAPSLSCNSNTDCAVAGAGTCTSNGGGALRQPNTCNDGVCSPDPGGEPGEGVCLAGPIETYCDGMVRTNGDGIINCSTNADCDLFDPYCPGGTCGDCTLSKTRECFLDPIVANGVPGKTIVGAGCLGPTTSAAVNYAAGWPGAYRVKQRLAAELFCSDGVTPFNPPGGSNCP